MNLSLRIWEEEYPTKRYSSSIAHPIQGLKFSDKKNFKEVQR
jgi:hypothetical protein